MGSHAAIMIYRIFNIDILDSAQGIPLVAWGIRQDLETLQIDIPGSIRYKKRHAVPGAICFYSAPWSWSQVMHLTHRTFLRHCVACAGAIHLTALVLGRRETALTGKAAPTVLWLQGSG